MALGSFRLLRRQVPRFLRATVKRNQKRPWLAPTVAAVAGSAFAGACLAHHTAQAEAAQKYPVYSRAEVAKHTTPDSRIWVTFKDGIYDITDFVENHPGGMSKIMLAAGQAVEPFWRVYQQHYNSPLPQQLLAEMQIGVLDPSEKAVEFDMSDPYSTDPERHPGLVFHNRKPCNAELPTALMMDSWLTPNELWFIRHHHPVPNVNPSEYRLTVEAGGRDPVVYTLEALKRFPQATVVSTIQCGGNKRSELDKIEKTSGISWGCGAMSTAEFKGVYLRDVLKHAHRLVPENAAALGVKHVQFEAIDGCLASVPVEKVLNPYGDVLLAFEMNGQPLPREHGFPVRVIVPGTVGIRNIKWLNKVIAHPEEAQGPWQRGIAYKGFPPGLKSFEGVDLDKVLSVQEQPVTSTIVHPPAGTVVSPGESITVRGIAWSGGGRGIARVDVSADNAASWTTATLREGSEQPSNRAWAWTFWETEIQAPKTVGSIEICSKATDAAYNVQPESLAPYWNARGLNANAWSRVKVTVAEDPDDE